MRTSVTSSAQSESEPCASRLRSHVSITRVAENADEKTLRREQARWKAADGDADGRLSQAEFVALVHPELFAHMERTLVDETLEDMDKNHNGRIERDEFLDDVLKQEGELASTLTFSR